MKMRRVIVAVAIALMIAGSAFAAPRYTVVRVYSMDGCAPCRQVMSALRGMGAHLSISRTSSRPSGIAAFPTVEYMGAGGEQCSDQGETIYSGDARLPKSGVVRVSEWSGGGE
jgi:hypothetical protein